MHRIITNGPSDLETLLAANVLDEHEHRKKVEFTFQGPIGEQRRIKVFVLLTGVRKHGCTDVFLELAERVGSDWPERADSIYHFRYDPRTRKGELVDMNFEQFAAARAEGRNI